MKRRTRVEQLARRRNRRRQSRLLARGMLTALACAALLGGAGYFGWSQWTGKAIDFPALYASVSSEISAHSGIVLQQVTVEGRNRTDSDALQTALGVQIGAPLQQLDLTAMQAHVEALPWVAEASLERLLPGRLHVELRERTPLAIWQSHGALSVLDMQGQIIAGADAGQFSNLPMVVGEGAQKHVHTILRTLQKSPELFARVQAVVRVSQRRWDVHFDNGIIAMLPERQVEKSWLNFAGYEQEHALLGRSIKAVDLRIAGRMVLRLPEGSTGIGTIRPAHQPSGV